MSVAVRGAGAVILLVAVGTGGLVAKGVLVDRTIRATGTARMLSKVGSGVLLDRGVADCRDVDGRSARPITT